MPFGVPIWAKIALIIFGILVLTGTTRYLARERLALAFRNLPDERRQKLAVANMRIIKVYRLLLWVLPANAMAVLSLGYAWQDVDLMWMGVIIVLAFIVALEDYFFRRAMVKRISAGHGAV